MPRRRRVLTLVTLAAVALISVSAWAATPSPTRVHVQRKLNVLENVHISFHPTDQLPSGGYYYAVLVLKPYRHYTRQASPPCATSSNMQRTDYGYLQPGRPVALALAPANSRAGHWCRGGSYLGGIYAVPHTPPCSSTYPCRSEPYESPRPCFKPEASARIVCGVVAHPRIYAYPEGLPAPLAPGTRIIARFGVRFPAG
jgi:hypothetical protein